MASDDCIRAVHTLAGGKLTEPQVREIVAAVESRARRLQRDLKIDTNSALKRAAVDFAGETDLAARIEKVNRIRNLQKRVAYRNQLETAPNVPSPIGPRGGMTPGPVVGLEASLTGVNTLYPGARDSIQKDGATLKLIYVDGMVAKLERGGLLKTVRSGDLDALWSRELAELNKTNGKPGVTGNGAALEIAKIVHEFQERARLDANKEGAFIGQYEGYVSRTIHDADRIRKAGYEAWSKFLDEHLDERTFDDVADKEAFYKNGFAAFTSGIHLTADGDVGLKDPGFKGPGNLAKKVSQNRVYHWKDQDNAWFKYFQQFGTPGPLINAVARQLERSAERTALMKHLGTNPKAEYENHKRWLKQKYRDDVKVIDALNKAESKLDNQFADLDGTSRTTKNRMRAQIWGTTRAVMSMAKLGAAVFSSVSDLYTHASELNYQGMNLLQAYGAGVASIVRGRGTGAEREVADLLLIGLDGMRGTMISGFHSGDTAPGVMSKIQNAFFKLSLQTYWTDAQRNGAAQMMARHLAVNADKQLDALPGRLGPLLQAHDIKAADWELIRNTNMMQANGKKLLTPDLVDKIPAAAIIRHLRAIDDATVRPDDRLRGLTRQLREAATAEQLDAAVTLYREDLALKLHGFYQDRSQFAVIEPGTKERAMMYQGQQPGTGAGEALRLFWQFKAFPVAMISKVWGRELYGRERGMPQIAGMLHMIVATTALGYLGMVLKDFVKGRTPRDPKSPDTWRAAFMQGGGAGIFGDFFFGEVNRFGGGPAQTAVGPTFGAFFDLVNLWQKARSGDDVSANALRVALNNVPYLNLFYTRIALDYLLLFQLQEAVNPGFLRRYERKVEKEQGQTFILRPSESALGVR